RAGRPHAPAVACHEGETLLGAEEPLLSTDVEWIAAAIHGDLGGAMTADVAVDDRAGQRLSAVFGEPDGAEPAEGVAWPDHRSTHRGRGGRGHRGGANGLWSLRIGSLRVRSLGPGSLSV